MVFSHSAASFALTNEGRIVGTVGGKLALRTPSTRVCRAASGEALPKAGARQGVGVGGSGSRAASARLVDVCVVPRGGSQSCGRGAGLRGEGPRWAGRVVAGVGVSTVAGRALVGIGVRGAAAGGRRVGVLGGDGCLRGCCGVAGVSVCGG